MLAIVLHVVQRATPLSKEGPEFTVGNVGITGRNTDPGSLSAAYGSTSFSSSPVHGTPCRHRRTEEPPLTEGLPLLHCPRGFNDRLMATVTAIEMPATVLQQSGDA